MLVRLVLENVFSFDEQKEFNTIPYNKLRTLNEHKYQISNFNILKLASIYGANGAGKSNLVKALFLLQKMVTEEEIPFHLRKSRFKFSENQDQVFAVEFFQDSTPFYYAIKLTEGRIAEEELYLSGLGKENDNLLFERKTNDENISEITFMPEFEKDEKSRLLKSILLEEFIKPKTPIFKLLSNRDNPFLQEIKKAYKWFESTLQVITPESKPAALAQNIDTNPSLKKYAEELMRSFNLGIESLYTEKIDIRDFFGRDNENELADLIKKVEESPRKMIGLRAQRGDEIIIVKEDGEIWVKILKIVHSGLTRNESFNMMDESDGTIRLLDFAPAFMDIISREKVYVVDEIERSIHPLLIKELIRKFSLDNETKGQLIFTTHESNLLDQEIFRRDEIWFVEKDMTAATDIYSLVDFQEHKTIDIRKGYLSGRYGSIPFLGNLQDLNWQEYDTTEQTV